MQRYILSLYWAQVELKEKSELIKRFSWIIDKTLTVGVFNKLFTTHSFKIDFYSNLSNKKTEIFS